MLVLKQIRKSKNISQQKLADMIGVSRSTVAMWETGASQPDNEILVKLAEYFNVTVDYLLGRSNDPEGNSLDKQLDGIDFALFGEVKDLTEEEKKTILDFVKFTKSQRNTPATYIGVAAAHGGDSEVREISEEDHIKALQSLREIEKEKPKNEQ